MCNIKYKKKDWKHVSEDGNIYDNFFLILHKIIGRKLVYVMLEKDPELRISLKNILTHKFITNHYKDENKEENKSQHSFMTKLNLEEILSMEEKKIRKKIWKKSLTQKNDKNAISYNENTEGVASKIQNDLNPKLKKTFQQEAKSEKFFYNNVNLMPPPQDEYQKFSSNKMLGSSVNDSYCLETLDNHEQLKSVN